MSRIKNSGSDQYGAGPLEQQQFGTAGTLIQSDHFNVNCKILMGSAVKGLYLW